MPQNALELYDLYAESMARELINKSQSCALTWNFLSSGQFQATNVDESVDPSVTWDFFVTRTQTGSNSARYSLDIKKDSVSYASFSDGPLPWTSRDSVIAELYSIVEMIVLQTDQKLKEAIQFVQNMSDCRS